MALIRLLPPRSRRAASLGGDAPLSRLMSLNCTIPANPDITGIGVRLSIYAQAILAPATFAVWIFMPRHVSEDIALDMRVNALTVLLTGCALLGSTFIEARLNGLDVYHGLLVLNLSWLNNITSCLPFLASMGWAVKRRNRWYHANEWKVFISPFGLHLTAVGVYGIWLFYEIGNVDPQAPCHEVIVWVAAGHRVPATSSSLRTFFLVVSVLVTVPFVNVGIMILTHLPLIPIGLLLPPSREVFFLLRLGLCALPCLFIVLGTEQTIASNQPYIGEGEGDWTFGQTLAVLLLVLPLWATLSDLAKVAVRSTRRKPESLLNADIQGLEEGLETLKTEREELKDQRWRSRTGWIRRAAARLEARGKAKREARRARRSAFDANAWAERGEIPGVVTRNQLEHVRQGWMRCWRRLAKRSRPDGLVLPGSENLDVERRIKRLSEVIRLAEQVRSRLMGENDGAEQTSALAGEDLTSAVQGEPLVEEGTTTATENIAAKDSDETVLGPAQEGVMPPEQQATAMPVAEPTEPITSSAQEETTVILSRKSSISMPPAQAPDAAPPRDSAEARPARDQSTHVNQTAPATVRDEEAAVSPAEGGVSRKTGEESARSPEDDSGATPSKEAATAGEPSSHESKERKTAAPMRLQGSAAPTEQEGARSLHTVKVLIPPAKEPGSTRPTKESVVDVTKGETVVLPEGATAGVDEVEGWESAADPNQTDCQASRLESCPPPARQEVETFSMRSNETTALAQADSNRRLAEKNALVPATEETGPAHDDAVSSEHNG